jgi:hypothetical protein
MGRRGWFIGASIEASPAVTLSFMLIQVWVGFGGLTVG